jgi:hypothetical protein
MIGALANSACDRHNARVTGIDLHMEEWGTEEFETRTAQTPNEVGVGPLTPETSAFS